MTFSGAGILLPFVRKGSIGGGGGGGAFLTNGVSNITQTGLNLINSPSTNGLVLTFNNPSGSTVQLGLTGQLTSAGMSPTGASGTFTNANITVDVAGRITAASNGSGGTSGSCVLAGIGSGGFTNVTVGQGLSYSAPNLTCVTGSSSTLGCLRPDGTTITSSGGVLTAVGSGNTPYVVPSFTGSPQTVTAATHHQGADAKVICWFSSSPSVGMDCAVTNSNPAGAGDITFAYGATPFRVVIYTPGGAGIQGAVGPTGPAGSNGTNGAISRIYNAGSALPVEPFLNFVSGGCVDNSGAMRTDCTGTGGGAGTASQLGDLTPVNTTSTRQTLGGSCSSSTPCNYRVGNVVFTITAPVTVDISGTSANDTIGYYLSSGTLFAGNNGAETLTCSSGCTTAGGFVANTWPVGSVPLWQTTLTANTWDTIVPATMDKRAVYSTQNIKAGSNIGVVPSPIDGSITISLQSSPTITGTAAFTINTTTFSSTPVFNLALGNFQTITLTGNVSSSTVSNPVTGDRLVFNVCQDATGSRTFVWPTGFKGTMTIGSTASKCNTQEFYYDGSSYWALSAGQTNQ